MGWILARPGVFLARLGVTSDGTSQEVSTVGSTPVPGKSGAGPSVVSMGLQPGQVVQELGWDSDVDEDFREALMDAVDADLVEEAIEAVDAVLLWWRSDDGDVGDGLMDSLRDLSSTGHIWLMTPKVGRAGYVDAADINEGAVTAGLVVASPVPASADWQAVKIVRPRTGRR
ncbi:MAG: DUF3052 domain-containing protein [Nigerium sp.]|nr:DUF3052 domain-containing protein [Nigerium sp.]